MHVNAAELREAFNAAEAECTPLIIRGLASEWPACSKWNGEPGLQYLEAKAGQEEVQVSYLSDLLLEKSGQCQMYECAIVVSPEGHETISVRCTLFCFSMASKA